MHKYNIDRPLVYQGAGLDTPVEVRLEGETVWLSQNFSSKYAETINHEILNDLKNCLFYPIEAS